MAWARFGNRLEREPNRQFDALAAYESSITANPGNTSAYERYERLLRSENKLPRAKAFFDGAAWITDRQDLVTP